MKTCLENPITVVENSANQRDNQKVCTQVAGCEEPSFHNIHLVDSNSGEENGAFQEIEKATPQRVLLNHEQRDLGDSYSKCIPTKLGHPLRDSKPVTLGLEVERVIHCSTTGMGLKSIAIDRWTAKTFWGDSLHIRS
ncbi:hypothetical protein TNCV_4377151 [Trichonephila clavipes]|nr:hypothetical protein TNCV_4377151 [Trichonephila clavipes]